MDEVGCETAHVGHSLDSIRLAWTHSSNCFEPRRPRNLTSTRRLERAEPGPDSDLQWEQLLCYRPKQALGTLIWITCKWRFVWLRGVIIYEIMPSNIRQYKQYSIFYYGSRISCVASQRGLKFRCYYMSSNNHFWIVILLTFHQKEKEKEKEVFIN